MNRTLKKTLTGLGLATLMALPAAAFAQDSDSDGVANAADAFPCDASRASVSYFPGETSSALLAFEDQWPNHTDVDYNDVAVRAHYRLERNAAGNVVSLVAVFDPVALGGDFSSGLGLQLPTSRTGVTARRRIAGGAWQSVTLEGDANATVVLSSNLRELYGNASGRINSRANEARQSGQRLELEVTFATPAAISQAAAPFDTFIFRSGNLGHQIHFPQYAGTAAMNAALFNSDQDTSTATRRFVTGSGVPAALNLMTTTRYPLEGVGISALFPDIAAFASSGGAQNAAFYATNVVSAQGHDVAALALPAVAAADTACIVTAPAGFVMVPAGTYALGGGANSSEIDTTVTLTRSFYLQATEVTQGQWKALSDNVNPSCFQTAGSTSCTTASANDSAPVERVSWWAVLGYLNALSASQGLPACYTLPASGCTGTWQAGTLSCGNVNPTVNAASVYACTGYRLPTEAEWEVAARGGQSTDTYAGNFTGFDSDQALTSQPAGYTGVSALSGIAWFTSHAGGRSRPVQGLMANQYGLYDMLGNVGEWTWDWQRDWSANLGTDPSGPGTGSFRVFRGGSWFSVAASCRAARRFSFAPGGRGNAFGFRPARSAGP